MSARSSLLEDVRGLLERTYLIRSGLRELAPFVIGDHGYRRLYTPERVVSEAGTAASPVAKTLIRETDTSVRASIYFPDDMIRRLERHPPQCGVHDANVDAFAAFVEEIDHLLLIAERSRLDRPLTLFELELQANISKHLVLARFLAGAAGRLSQGKRLWLRSSLFALRYEDDDPGVRTRYRDAARWAVRLIDRLGALEGRTRLRVLRTFHGAGAQGKLEIIQGLAN